MAKKQELIDALKLAVKQLKKDIVWFGACEYRSKSKEIKKVLLKIRKVL